MPENISSLIAASLRIGRRPRMHPNGFVQFPLDEHGHDRLHIFFDDTRVPAAHTIHDHVFTMRSDVLFGELVHVEYDVEFTLTEPENGFQLWVPSTDDDSERETNGQGGSPLEPTVRFAEIAGVRKSTLPAGSTYHFPAFSFHDTGCNGYTVTRMRKVETFNAEPRVLVRVGKHPDDFFGRDEYTQGELIAALGVAAERCRDA